MRESDFEFQKIPPEAERVLTELRHIMTESAERAPHVCKAGCHCRAAYRRAIAERLGDYEGPK